MDLQELIAKRKSIPFKVKSDESGYKEVDTTNRIVKIVANTLNFFDYDKDVLLPGCANRSMSDRGAKSSAVAKIAHLLHHDMHRPVGKSMLEAEETIDGKKVLYCESFLPDTTDGDDTLVKYEVGIYNQHSIGLRYVDINFIEKGAAGWDKIMKKLLNPEAADAVGYLWAVKEINWFEYSTVTFGANELTPYLGTKSKNKNDVADIISQKLAILANKAMRREIKDKTAFDFELAQLQQMIFELSEMEPSKKSAPMDSQLGETPEIVKLSGFSKKLNLKF